MVKELLSGINNMTKPSDQSDSIKPYLSMMITIITITLIAYGLQTTTSDLHTYAVNPASIKSNTVYEKYCNDLVQTSLKFICSDVKQSGNDGNYPEAVFSFEQDLQSPMK
jgi:hypothetical protein